MDENDKIFNLYLSEKQELIEEKEGVCGMSLLEIFNGLFFFAPICWAVLSITKVYLGIMTFLNFLFGLA